jgi:hypothetical protein
MLIRRQEGHVRKWRQTNEWTALDGAGIYRSLLPAVWIRTPVPVAGPPSPVSVDMSWYMSDGPGRFYHPGMFPIIASIAKNGSLTPGTYNLLDFVPNRNANDPSLAAKISNYTTRPLSEDYKTRALVFGDESARISGQVVVKPDGSKTFEKVEIKPWDTNFRLSPQ